MTLASENMRTSYDGDGSTTSFSVPFVFWSADDLEVILRASNGDETVWTRGTQYTVSGGGSSTPATGTVTVSTSPTDYTPASGTKLIIRSSLAYTQGLNLASGGQLPSTQVMQQFNKLVRMIQQVNERAGRGIRFPASDLNSLDAVLPDSAERALMLLGFDASGNVTVTDPDDVSATATVISAFMGTLLDDTDAATARATLGITATAVDIFAADYGATGDGTTDDTTDLDEAIDACAAGQRLRLTPNKTYITTGITLDNAGMVLDLNGATLKLKANQASGTKLITIAADDVRIVGPGTLDGNKANQSTPSDQNCIYADGYDRFVLDGFRITGAGGFGAYLVDTVDSLVRGIRADNTGGTAIQWGYDGEDLTRCITQDCYVDRSDDAANDGGCIKYSKLGSSVQAVNDCAIVNCRALMHDTPTGSDVVPLEFWGSGGRNRIIGCHVQGGAFAISIANGQHHGLVGGCTVFDPDTYGIEIVDAIHCAVVGNVVDGNADATRGIIVDGTNTAADATAVVGNTIRRCTDAGIYFHVAAPGSLATGNTIDVAGAAAYGIYSNTCDDLTITGNNIDGNGTALVGIGIIQASDISITGNNISNFTAQAILGSQNAAGTMDRIAITGGSMSGTSYVAFQSSGGGSLGTDLTIRGVAGYLYTTGVAADVLDAANSRIRGWGTGDPEGSVVAGVGSTYTRLGGAIGAQVYVKEAGTGNVGWRALAPTTRVEVTIAYSDLASAASKTLIAAITSARFKIRDITLSGAGTNFSGGSGDRNIAIQDSSGTTIWSVIPAATAQSLAHARWGDAGLPEPSTAAHLTAQSVAGEALVAKYSGGTNDYTAGSLTLIIEYERTT